MRVSLDWLGEFIALPPEEELVERLELGGFEDVVIERPGPDLSAIRVGRVVDGSVRRGPSGVNPFVK